MSDCIREILLEELETVNCALRTCVTEPVIDQDDLLHWSDRLARVNKALQSLENNLYLTEQEWNTLALLVDFHTGAFDTEPEEAPYDLRAFEALVAKLHRR